MSELATPAIIVVAAFLSSTIAGVIGFGSGVILLPVLVWAFGVREAVPILTVAQLLGNLSRVYFSRHELVLPVVGWFCLGAVPLSIVGAVLFATVPAPLLQRLLGVFFLVFVAIRHTHWSEHVRVSLRGFALVGAALGFLGAVLGATGPLMTPFFLSYGLVKGAFIGTEALATVVMHVVKLAIYGGYALIGVQSILTGVAIGAVTVLGSYLGKRILDRLPERAFEWIVEGLLVVTGLQFLIFG